MPCATSAIPITPTATTRTCLPCRRSHLSNAANLRLVKVRSDGDCGRAHWSIWAGAIVGACCLRHPQPVEGEQRHQRVLGRSAEPCGDEQGADLVAIQADGVGLVVDPGAADVRSRGVVEQTLLDRVLVQRRRSWTSAWSRWSAPVRRSQVRGRTARCRPGGRRTAAGGGCGTRR